MLVEIGKFVNTHGIKGEIRVLSNSDFVEERFKEGQTIVLKYKGQPKEFIINSYRKHKNFHLLKFENINNINDIEYLKGSKVFQEQENNEIELEENEFFYSDIIGCEVISHGKTIGHVEDIMETGANDVFIVQGQKEYLIPYIEDIVKDIDINNKSITIDPIEGLLE